MATWKLSETRYAGHNIKVEYEHWNNLLRARISGPRSGHRSNDRYANDVEWKMKLRIPFMSPPANKIEKNVWPIKKEARKRIDNAIAAHAKKYEEDYQ